MKMPFLLISPKIVPKIQLIKKGGCFEYHAVIADKIKYRYVHRASICPALGMDRRSFFMPKPMGKYKRLEVFYLSKPVYTADKPSDCHYCYFWTNGRKGCRLGRNNCYYLISLPPKSKSECDDCPYGRDHPCIGWCTKKVMREVGLRWYGWTGDIYPAGGERKRTIGKLSKKELARLHSDPGFLKFARKQIQWYRENNPKINFYVLEWFTTLTRRSKLAAIKQEEVADVFVFVRKSEM